MDSPDVASLKSLLNISRLVALVLFIVGIIWVGLTAAADAALGAGAIFFVGNLAYPVIFTIFEFLAWALLKAPIDLVNQGRFAPAREQTIFPMILGFIAVLIVGLLLLLAYLKFDSILAAQAGAVSPMAPGWGAPAAPPPMAPSPPLAGSASAVGAPTPMAPPPPPPVVAAGATCPRCGQPAAWIAQYGRWYCYTDRMYL